MPLEWNDSLSIGVAEIDDQHKELFKRFARVLDACTKGQGSDEVRSLLLFLDEYVRIHFRDEERLQLEIGFPEYGEHRRQHLAFIEQVAALEETVLADGATLSVITRANNMLTDWLVHHISRMDRKIGEFIRRKASRDG
jgi:hemerythrin